MQLSIQITLTNTHYMKEIPPSPLERERIGVKVRSPLLSSNRLKYTRSNSLPSLADEVSSYFTKILLELSE